MKKIAVTGASGYIASLVQRTNAGRFEFLPVRHKDLDFADPEKVHAYFEALDFDLVLNTAAQATTAVCEKEPELTHRINTESAIAIADVCRQKGRRLIAISSEQCLNGHTDKGPFTEAAEAVSVTRYGQQKAEADAWIQSHLENYVILRFSWMMGMAMPGVKPSPNIIRNMLSALHTRTPALFTVHEVRGMTYAQRLADQFTAITELPSGLYNFSSVNHLCTYDAACYIAAQFGASPEDIRSYILPNNERYAERARDYRLDCTKIKAQGIQLGTFEEDVQQCLQDFGWLKEARQEDRK